MTLRMHPVSPSRWKQLAASRHPIDLTATYATSLAAEIEAVLRHQGILAG